jgi:hypothetical protein
MSTHSTISILNTDGTVNSIFCQWDGFIDGNGEILKEHYTDINKIKQLIALGCISTLDKECTKPENHSFENRVDGFTVAYHRDRGEDWEYVKTENFDNYESFRLEADFQEFNYLYKDGEWYVMCGDKRSGEWAKF